MAEVLTRSQLQRLIEHKYSAEGCSLLEPKMQIFWRWLVEQVPLWWAPNAITLIGLIMNVASVCVMVYYSPDARQEVWLIYHMVLSNKQSGHKGSLVKWPRDTSSSIFLKRLTYLLLENTSKVATSPAACAKYTTRYKHAGSGPAAVQIGKRMQYCGPWDVKWLAFDGKVNITKKWVLEQVPL